MSKGILFLVILLSAIPTMIVAQEDDDDDDKSPFQKKIDEIVNETFRRFDEQFHTYIFTEEPEDYEDENCEECDGDMRRKHHRTSWSSYGRELYASSYDSRLKRAKLLSIPWEPLDEHLLIWYNRVESLFLGVNFPNRYSWDTRSISLFGSVGYGFASHRWRYNGGLAQQFGMGKTLIEVGVEGHSLTDSRDQWLVGDGENSLAAVLLRDDYRDYFGREGFSAWAGLYGRWRYSDMQFRIAFLNDQYASLDRATNWSVFGGEKLFRDNPPVNEGRMKSILTSFEWHYERERSYFTTGWNLAASMEVAGQPFASDFTFHRYVVEATRYQQLGRYENLNVRFRAGAGTGDVPLQKGFDLGGISTMPAFSYKEFSGNRLLLANAEYLLNGKLFDDVENFPSWLLRNTNFILFYDAGYVATAPTNASALEGFEHLTIDKIKSDWGFGIGTRDATMRLAFAWRTDVAEPVHVFLRLSRPF